MAKSLGLALQKLTESQKLAQRHHATLLKAEKAQQLLLRNTRLLRAHAVASQRRILAWYVLASCVTRDEVPAAQFVTRVVAHVCVSVSVCVC